VVYFSYFKIKDKLCQTPDSEEERAITEDNEVKTTDTRFSWL
jgi:hypothetical protein